MVEKTATNPLLINLSVLLAQPTGISHYATSLLPHLQPLQPTLLAAKQIAGYCCHRIPGNLSPEYGAKGHARRLWWTQFRLASIFRQLEASLLFSPVPEAPLYRRCCAVVMVHDLIPLRFPQRSSLTYYCRTYVPQVLAQAEHIICNSTATARDIADFYGISAGKITPIQLAYDAERFFSGSSRQISSTPYFLYVGRHNPHKNLHRLIQAFASVRCGDYQLWLAGAPDRRYTPHLQTQVEELGLSDRVRFLDYVPEDQLPTLIRNATALVFPSLWEGFGLPVLEAMACGTPVMTSNVSSLPEVAGDAALLVDPYSTSEIAGAIATLAEEAPVRSHLSRLGLKQAKQFSWQKTGQATAEILQNYL
ncbi:MAG: glycosyltransferase family 4 protein [Cyanophyceae cyanobacterium]